MTNHTKDSDCTETGTGNQPETYPMAEVLTEWRGLIDQRERLDFATGIVVVVLVLAVILWWMWRI